MFLNRLLKSLLTAGCLAAGAGLANAQLSITEFMASNNKTLADDDGDYSDWIEIYNGGPSSVNLQGWSLTDDDADPAKWRFPSTNLAANAYMIVFASGKDRTQAGSTLHTSFSLNVDGEYLALVHPDGETIATDFKPQYPPQSRDFSYGLNQQAGNGSYLYFSTPTPGRANGSGFADFVAPIRFSHERGFFETPFNLTLTATTPEAVIRYTTNGTAPTATSGLIYSGPLPINSTKVIRAAAFKEGFQPSKVATQTYLFLEDVIRQSSNGAPPPGWPSSWGANVVDYGMDPDVVNNPLYSGSIKEDLKAIPSFSIVMNLNDLFDRTTGIYANPGQDGRTWERPTSLELINPDGSDGFQVNAGIRIRGGFSRSTDNPKHAFRFFFRAEYGDSKLVYPLFGDKGTDTFNAIDLRTFQNYSWSFQGDPSGVFFRDQFSRDTQLAMGHQGERGNYYHLYINGVYWGLFNTCERPEASYAETYFGGNADDYDVIKVEAGPYTINATDGNMLAWTELYNAARAGLASNEAYFKVQGRNPDGTINPAYKNLVDVPNLIDYMLIIIYGGNLDAPISNFLGNTSPNNWYGIRNRNGTNGFRFFSHDAEHTLLNVNENRTGPFSSGDTGVTKSNPQWIWQKMWSNPEFKILAADHIHKHFFNGGILTPGAVARTMAARTNEIYRAVVGESARWGDSKRSTPLTRANWLNSVNNILNSYVPQRSTIVLNQLRAKGLYPNVTAPSFSQHGGNVQKGFQLTMSAPSGTIYYTIDGTDPRLLGGEVSPAARLYSGPVALNESAQVKSRVLDGTVWSALNEAPFTVIQTYTDVLITEIMYHPSDEGSVDGDEFEFIELKNVSNTERDLSGVHFSNGISYTFPNGTTLAPGRFLVLAKNIPEFQNKYPRVPVHGQYTGNLANSGETVTLSHAVGTPIFSVKYSDQAPWPTSADGGGFSLVPVHPNANPDPDAAADWRASSRAGGSPGADDLPVNIGAVWITEALTHTDPPQADSIELHNPGTQPVDIGGWFLTDNQNVPKKFRIPAGTSIPAGGYRVFTEQDFNANPGAPSNFNLSSHGEEVYLFSADESGNLTGFSDGFAFGAAANGVSFGRYVNSVGEVHHPAQLEVTLGAANSGPRIGPVVINEIQYQPAAGDEEFIELKNVTDSPVRLYDPQFPTNTWQINGVGFTFPPNTEIPANGFLLVVGADSSYFRAKHSIPANVQVFGPYPGVLQDSGELLQLVRPDTPDTGANGEAVVPYLVVDEVRYNDKSPWPVEAAGSGASLERSVATAYGNDPAAWRASFGAPSPGLPNDGNRRPIINAGIDQQIESPTFPVTVTLSGRATDDGQPNPPGAVSFKWSVVSGPGATALSTPNQAATTATLPGVGTYTFRLTADDGDLQAADDVIVEVTRPSMQTTLVNTGATWKYLDTGDNLGTSWRAPGFNDSSWPSGRSQLGYGDGDEATVVGSGPNSQSKYITTYFRLAFNIANKGTVKKLTASLMRDDGAVVYLNGTEVFRSNMPEGSISYTTRASSVVGGGDESAYFDREIDAGVLVDGRNVLAVEVHQESGASTDISFDLRLIALMDPQNQAPTVNAGPDATVVLPAVHGLNGSVADDGLPQNPGHYSATWSKVSGPGTVTFGDANLEKTSARFSEPGVYVLRLTATDGALSAQDEATVTVTGTPEESYEAWAARYFNAQELNDPSISGATADPDKDGHTNQQEFTAGTDPRNGSSVLKLLSTQSGAQAKLRFTAVAGKSYTVQYRESLQAGSWIKLRDIDHSDTTQEIETTDSITGQTGSRYYRIVTPKQP